MAKPGNLDDAMIIYYLIILAEDTCQYGPSIISERISFIFIVPIGKVDKLIASLIRSFLEIYAHFRGHLKSLRNNVFITVFLVVLMDTNAVTLCKINYTRTISWAKI